MPGTSANPPPDRPGRVTLQQLLKPPGPQRGLAVGANAEQVFAVRARRRACSTGLRNVAVAHANFLPCPTLHWSSGWVFVLRVHYYTEAATGLNLRLSRISVSPYGSAVKGT